MENTQVLDPVQFCKNILREERQHNCEHNIDPSINIVIDRMLEGEWDLNDLLGELHCKLGNVPNGVLTFLDSILTVAAHWHPEAISEQRAAKKRLNELKISIAESAENLAAFIQERDAISNDSGFSSNSHYHIVDVMEEAGETSHRYRSWVSKKMQALRNEFGLKYWPPIADIVRVLAADARCAEIEARDMITNAATDAIRPSKSDFVRALYAALDERSERQPDRLPNDFNLSDGSMASLVNCLLDLCPDEVIDNLYIKGFRQRKRNAT